MKELFLASILLLFALKSSNAQIIINVQSPATAASVVTNNFITSGAGTVTNVVLNAPFTGRFATFSGTSNLGVSNGIVLSTGNTANIPNPHSMQIDDGFNCGPFYPIQCPDAQLQALTPTNSINDATTLLFDFQPATDTIRFQYVFGSEEYPEYVCHINDVFGFFVNGSNPAGGSYFNKNVALIPNTNMPVSVNSVNPGIPGSASGGGVCSGPGESLAYSAYYVSNFDSTIIFDGFTTVLDVTIPVVVLDTYQIKLGVCNAKDGIFESAAFLRDNTFGGNAPRIAIANTPGITISNDTVFVCNGGTVTFSSPKAVAYNWSTGSTTQSITLNQPVISQTVNCMLSNPVTPAFLGMAPVYLVADNSCTVSLNEMNAEADIKLNFNANSNELNLSSKHALPEGTIFKIYNMSGSKMVDFKTGMEDSSFLIPLQNINSGIYIVHVYNKNINLTKRFEKF